MAHLHDPVTKEQIDRSAAFIRGRTQYQPRVGVILGSGLAEFASTLEEPEVIPFDQVPHWPVPTVAGHPGRIVLGRARSVPVMVLQGRSHLYEGYHPSVLGLSVWTMAALGVTILIITNAAGGLNPQLRPGDLMLIRDHLNLPGLAGQNPLAGLEVGQMGPLFVEMGEAYDLELRRLATSVASAAGLRLMQGIYAMVAGPSYETPAEIHFLRSIGADAVGMSTAPEVVVASQMGMRVLGISCITNVPQATLQEEARVSHEEVLLAAAAALPRFARIVLGVLGRLA